MAWGWAYFQHIFLSGWTIPLSMQLIGQAFVFAFACMRKIHEVYYSATLHVMHYNQTHFRMKVQAKLSSSLLSFTLSVFRAWFSQGHLLKYLKIHVFCVIIQYVMRWNEHGFCDACECVFVFWGEESDQICGILWLKHDGPSGCTCYCMWRPKNKELK